MKKKVILTFEDFVLRPWQEGDEASLAAYANNHKIWVNVRDRFPHPYTLEDAELWVRIANADHTMLNVAIETENKAVGGVGIIFKQDVYHRTAEIGYWLGEQYWNRGITSRAVKAMSEYIFDSPQFNICRMYAGIFEYNTASARVLEKAGFHLEARLQKSVTKDGNTVDELIYAKLKEN